MDIYENGKKTTLILNPGDTLYLPPFVPHEFFGLEHTEFFEFSTQHFEEDSYRISKEETLKIKP